MQTAIPSSKDRTKPKKGKKSRVAAEEEEEEEEEEDSFFGVCFQRKSEGKDAHKIFMLSLCA